MFLFQGQAPRHVKFIYVSRNKVRGAFPETIETSHQDINFVMQCWASQGNALVRLCVLLNRIELRAIRRQVKYMQPMAFPLLQTAQQVDALLVQIRTTRTAYLKIPTRLQWRNRTESELVKQHSICIPAGTCCHSVSR
jgi:hypothetical protein